MEGRVSQFCVCQIPFQKNIQVGLCNCVHLEIDFTRLKLDGRWLLPVIQHHPRGQLRLRVQRPRLKQTKELARKQMSEIYKLTLFLYVCVANSHVPQASLN